MELRGLYCSVNVVRKRMRHRYAVDECRNAHRLFDTWDGKRMLGKPRDRRGIVIVH